MSDTVSPQPRRPAASEKRRLKVYYAYANGSHDSYPVIRIAGKYLKSFGFEIGSMFTIDLSPGRIEVQKEKD